MVIPIIFTNRKIETTNGNIVEDEGKKQIKVKKIMNIIIQNIAK